MIEITSKGNFEKTRRWLESIQNGSDFTVDFDRYGQMGVDALERSTPVDTRLTAKSWYYTIAKGTHSTSIAWRNDNEVDGVKIVILLRYGHGTRGGTYVQGRNFIDPSVQPVFDTISKEIWKKVTRNG